MSFEVPAYRSSFLSPFRPVCQLFSFSHQQDILTWCNWWFAYSLLDFIQLTSLTSQDVLIRIASLHEISLLNLVEAMQPEARSSAGLEVERGEGMPGLLTGHIRPSEFEESEVFKSIRINTYSNGLMFLLSLTCLMG